MPRNASAGDPQKAGNERRKPRPYGAKWVGGGIGITRRPHRAIGGKKLSRGEKKASVEYGSHAKVNLLRKKTQLRELE